MSSTYEELVKTKESPTAGLPSSAHDFETESATEDPLQWLPSYAYDSETAQKLRERHQCSPYSALATPDEVFGRGEYTRIQRSALAILWSFFLVSPWIGMTFAQCPSHGQGFAQVPTWLTQAYALLVAFHFAHEFYLLRRVLPCQVAILGPFTVMGMKMPFSLWFAFAASLSMVMHLDVATNALFLAKAWKTDHCKINGDSSGTTRMWAQTMASSSLAGIPLVSEMSISNLALACWLLQLLQATTLYIIIIISSGGNGRRSGGDLLAMQRAPSLQKLFIVLVATSAGTTSAVASCSSYSLIVVYAATKLYMATYVCRHGLWNLSGCVESVKPVG